MGSGPERALPAQRFSRYLSIELFGGDAACVPLAVPRTLPSMNLPGTGTGAQNAAMSTKAQERNPSVPGAGLRM